MRKQLTAVFMAGVLGAACVAMAGCGQEASPAKADTEAVGVTETAETTEAADTLESEKAGDSGDAVEGSTVPLRPLRRLLAASLGIMRCGGHLPARLSLTS